MSDFEDFNRLVSKANKRYKRLSEKGWQTGAYKKANATGGKFSARGTYREKAREYKRVKNFLNSKTSTIRGSRKVVKDMLHRTGLEDIVGEDLDEIVGGNTDTSITGEIVEGQKGSTEDINQFFNIASMVDEYLEQHRGVKVSSDEIWRSIHDTYLAGDGLDYSDANADEIVAAVVRKLHKDYLESHGSSSSHNTWSTI